MPKKKPGEIVLEFDVRAVIHGQKGLDQFVRILRVLHENGFPETAVAFVSALEKEAKMRGIAFPDDLRRWGKANA